MIIDAHQHFWHYDPVEYNWISEDMGRLRKDFLPVDLLKEIRSAGVDSVISVQARQSIPETGWLLELAEKHEFIRAVTGWLPLDNENIAALIEKYSESGYLKALRHVLQAEPDEFMLREDF